ncbi:MAG: site-2 protease family protein [Patescibacteria group bacterium]
MEIIFGIIVLILSIILHEVAHGYAAEALGDPTARYAGRLTLNPIPHIDPVGSIILPLVTWFSGGFIFGWAKPVPYNPYNLRHGVWGEAWVAAAGPITNIAIAFIFGLLIRFAPIPSGLIEIFQLIVVVNISLAIFNLVPIPPLDGSKILFALLPPSKQNIRYALEQYGFILVIVFILVGWKFISPLVLALFSLFTGLSF